MSQLQRTSSVPVKIEKPLTHIEHEEKIDNWFKSILLFAILLLTVVGSIILLS